MHARGSVPVSSVAPLAKSCLLLRLLLPCPSMYRHHAIHSYTHRRTHSYTCTRTPSAYEMHGVSSKCKRAASNMRIQHGLLYVQFRAAY